MIYCALHYMRVYGGGLYSDNFAEPLSVPALLFPQQSPTGFIKQRSFESRRHTSGGTMLEAEECNNLMGLLQWENGTTDRCMGPALMITLYWSVKTLLSRC